MFNIEPKTAPKQTQYTSTRQFFTNTSKEKSLNSLSFTVTFGCNRVNNEFDKQSVKIKVTTKLLKQQPIQVYHGATD